MVWNKTSKKPAANVQTDFYNICRKFLYWFRYHHVRIRDHNIFGKRVTLGRDKVPVLGMDPLS